VSVSRRQTAVAGVVALALVGGGALWWWSASRNDESPVPAPSPSAGQSSTPTPGGTTTPSASASPTDGPDDPGTAPTPTPDPGAEPVDPGAVAPTTADVTTTYAGWNDLSDAVEVGAYAAVVEADGICTLTLSGPGGERSVQAAATPDVSTTACGALALPGDQLSSGTWQAVVTYGSPRSAGTSAPVEIEVP
jgi:hypothetical protein